MDSENHIVAHRRTLDQRKKDTTFFQLVTFKNSFDKHRYIRFVLLILTLGALIITTINPPSALVFTFEAASVSSSLRIFPEKISLREAVVQLNLAATRTLKSTICYK